MNKFKDLLLALQAAVAEAQRQLEKQHLTLLESFFIKVGETWEARTISIIVPPSTQPIQVPLISLVPLSSLRIKDLNFEFAVDLTRLENDIGDTHNLLVNLQPSHQGNVARVSLTLSGGEPPEGLMRLNDRIIREIP